MPDIQPFVHIVGAHGFITLGCTLALMALFKILGDKMTANLDKLTAAVTQAATVNASAIALLTGLKSELDTAIKASQNGDDTALPALSDKLGASTTALAAAIAANTPATTGATITLSPSELLKGLEGDANFNQSITAAGGQGPYAYSIPTGALPAGLSLNSTTGAITGTPTEAGTASFTVQAMDANGAVGTASYSLEIDAAPVTTTAITISPEALPDATVGAAYDQTITAQGGSGSGYVFTVQEGEELPAGLALSESGELTGTVTGDAGSDVVPITVTDGAGTPANFDLNLNVVAAAG